MVNRIHSLTLFFCLSAIPIMAWASPQAGYFFRNLNGFVKLEQDGKKIPVEGALVEVYIIEKDATIKGKKEVRTDKSGYYGVTVNYGGTYLLVVSGPGIQTLYRELNPNFDTQGGYTDTTVNFTAKRGAEHKPTLEEVKGYIRGIGKPAQPKTASEPDKANEPNKRKPLIFTAQYISPSENNPSSKADSGASKDLLTQAMGHYNKAVEMMQNNQFALAIPELQQIISIDPAKQKFLVNLLHLTFANLAEAHIQIGYSGLASTDMAAAKPSFEDAIFSIKKAISFAGSDTSPAANDRLLTYYEILEKDVEAMIVNFGDRDALDFTIANLDKAELKDAGNRYKWESLKGNLYNAAALPSEAAEAYNKALASSPKCLDALYGLSFILIASEEKEKQLSAAAHLSDFLNSAPQDDPRRTNAQTALEFLVKKYNLKSASKDRKKKG